MPPSISIPLTRIDAAHEKRGAPRLVPCNMQRQLFMGDGMPHARGVELVVELLDAAEHIDRIPTAELTALLEGNRDDPGRVVEAAASDLA